MTPSNEKSTKIKILHGQNLGFFKFFFGFLDFWIFLKFFIKEEMLGLESYVEKVPKFSNLDAFRGF